MHIQNCESGDIHFEAKLKRQHGMAFVVLEDKRLVFLSRSERMCPTMADGTLEIQLKSRTKISA